MSRPTPARILDAAWELLCEEGPAAATMSGIARAADLTRQAVYFHFPDRSSLFVALVAHVDDQHDLRVWTDKIDAAAGGVDKLRLLFAMQAHRNPTFAPVARVIEAARHTDDAAAAAWASASDARRAYCHDVLVPALDADGNLHPTWDHSEASAYLAQMTSFRLWDDLINLEGLATERYEIVMTAACAGALQAPAASTQSPDVGVGPLASPGS